MRWEVFIKTIEIEDCCIDKLIMATLYLERIWRTEDNQMKKEKKKKLQLHSIRRLSQPKEQPSWLIKRHSIKKNHASSIRYNDYRKDLMKKHNYGSTFRREPIVENKDQHYKTSTRHLYPKREALDKTINPKINDTTIDDQIFFLTILSTPFQLIHQQEVLPNDAQEVSTLHPLQERRPTTFYFQW